MKTCRSVSQTPFYSRACRRVKITGSVVRQWNFTDSLPKYVYILLQESWHPLWGRLILFCSFPVGEHARGSAHAGRRPGATLRVDGTRGFQGSAAAAMEVPVWRQCPAICPALHQV